MRNALPYLAIIAVIVGVVNLIWVTVEINSLGGEASTGYVSDGHYYVGDHGKFREVTQQDWEWNRLHLLSLFVTGPLLIAGLAYSGFAYLSRDQLGIPSGREASRVDEKVRQVRASGAQIVTERCRGRAGMATFVWGRNMDVSVFPGGILLQVLFSPTVAILPTEIQRIDVGEMYFGIKGVRISHSSRDIVSPIVLGVGPESPVGRALGEITGTRL